MGARAARDPARPGGGAGEDAARERLAGGLLGVLKVRPARGEACPRAPGASPRGRAPRRASTGGAEPASRGPHGEVGLPPDPGPGAGSGFSDGWERASDSGEGREAGRRSGRGGSRLRMSLSGSGPSGVGGAGAWVLQRVH